MTYKFEQHLDWKLLSGSHEFPGPSGGTCINEASLVAAGFEYKAVRNVQSMPDCFSRVISGFAMLLNDNLDDVTRQGLIKYVTRMSGTADTKAVEEQRKRAIDKILSEGITNLINSIASDHLLYEFFAPVNIASKMANGMAQNTFKELLGLVYFFPVNDTIYGKLREQMVKVGFDALDGAFAIGNSSTDLTTELVTTRFEKAKLEVAEVG